MIKSIKEKLVTFGLMDKEVEVYLTLLVNGELTAHEIANIAKINRSTTYVQLQSLSEIGLVTTFKRGKKTFFACESPRALERIFEKKSREIELQQKEMINLLPSLFRLFGNATERPIVRMFDGKEGLTTMREELLYVEGRELFVAFNIDSMLRIYNSKELMDYSYRRSKLKKKSFVMYSTIGEDIPSIPPQALKRVNKKDIFFGADIYICGDTVAFASTEKQIFGVMIENTDIAKSMKTLFMETWKNC